jgi:predicted enzyme related to lactoylglutathione lyase
MDIKKVVFMLMAQDMDRAITFYEDVIGLEVRYRSPNWTELGYGDAVVALHGGRYGEFKPTGLGFTVTDIDAACQEVRDGGGKVVSGPSERPGEPIMLAHLADTEGNGFELSQDVG